MAASFFQLENCVPSLQEALAKEPLDLDRIWTVAVPVRNPDERPPVPSPGDRRQIAITDGTKLCLWNVESLASLFRGDKQPPVLGDHPKEYPDTFALFDLQMLELSRVLQDLRDEEMLEIYSNLRRRPDGRSLGFNHDYMWQAAALVLGSRTLSKAEYEAILSRLERSCRTFRKGPTSRNFVNALRQIYSQSR